MVRKLFPIIEQNYLFAKDWLLVALPDLEISPLEGTFLMWVNFKKHVPSDIRIREYITRTCGVLVSDGYGTVAIHLHPLAESTCPHPEKT